MDLCENARMILLGILAGLLAAALGAYSNYHGRVFSTDDKQISRAGSLGVAIRLLVLGHVWV